MQETLTSIFTGQKFKNLSQHKLQYFFITENKGVGALLKFIFIYLVISLFCLLICGEFLSVWYHEL